MLFGVHRPSVYPLRVTSSLLSSSSLSQTISRNDGIKIAGNGFEEDEEEEEVIVISEAAVAPIAQVTTQITNESGEPPLIELFRTLGFRIHESLRSHEYPICNVM